LSEITEVPAAASYTCERCGTEYAEGDACPACGSLRAAVPCDDDASRAAHSRCVLCGRAIDDPLEANEPARCAEHRAVPVIEGFAQVYTNNNAFAAQLLVENLRAEGLDATLYSQADRSFPMDIGELSISRVLVPAFQYQQALELVREYMDTEGEVVFACPSCGEVFEPGQETCSSCGAALAG
jgi:predicted amidophosphoribosyltransferase